MYQDSDEDFHLARNDYDPILRISRDDNAIAFNTDGSMQSLVIDRLGHVGIGTSLPTYPLQVKGPGDVVIEATSTRAAGLLLSAAAEEVPFVRFKSGTAETYEIGKVPNGNFYFNRNVADADIGSHLVISEAGNVGIGTTTPLTALHIPERGLQIGVSSDPEDNFHFASDVLEGDVDRALRLYNGNYGSGAHIASFMPDGRVGLGHTNPDVHLDILGGDDLTPLKNAVIRLRASHVGGADASLVLGVGSGNAPYISDGDSATSLGLFFMTNGQNRMFINRAGRVSIGVTDPQSALHVNGTITATACACPSDARLKKDIVTISDARALVGEMRGVRYQWRDGRENGPRIGLIAQEVEAVLPEVVTTHPNGYKSVDYAKIVAVLVEANKQLDQDYRARTTALEDKIIALEQRLDAISRTSEASSQRTK